MNEYCLNDYYIIIFYLRTAAFKAYCAIWVRRSNFRHRASPRVSPRESTQRQKVELWARNVRKFCLNADFHVTFRDLSHAVKLQHGTDGFTSPPKEGVLRIFFFFFIWRLRPGVNPRTWISKASTLSLDHRSRFCLNDTGIEGASGSAVAILAMCHWHWQRNQL
jgi:hypothetical protein